jgi:hypothetical protein
MGLGRRVMGLGRIVLVPRLGPEGKIIPNGDPSVGVTRLGRLR